jgi:hypothetical protein
MSKWWKDLLNITLDSEILSINLQETGAAISVKSKHQAFHPGRPGGNSDKS